MELKALPDDMDVPWQATEGKTGEPGPGESGREQGQAGDDEKALHGEEGVRARTIDQASLEEGKGRCKRCSTATAQRRGNAISNEDS